MDDVSAGDERPRRLRALFDRIGALDGHGLSPVEHFVALVEVAPVGTKWTITPEFPKPGCVIYSTDLGSGKMKAFDTSGARRPDLDRMAEAITTVPGAPTMGRAIPNR